MLTFGVFEGPWFLPLEFKQKMQERKETWFQEGVRLSSRRLWIGSQAWCVSIFQALKAGQDLCKC